MKQIISPDNTFVCPNCHSVLSLDDFYCIKCEEGIEDWMSGNFDESFIDEDDFDDDFYSPGM